MSNPIELAFEEARRERAQGRPKEAERAYARAAELARLAGNELLLGHALRHMSISPASEARRLKPGSRRRRPWRSTAGAASS